MIGLMFKLAYKLLISWPWWIAITFTQYIEWFDAAMLGFFTYLVIWHYEVASTGVGIAMAVVVGAVFLALFHFSKIGFYISTTVFSLMWAYLIAGYPASLVPGNKIVYWIIFALIFAGCAWLHYCAKWRKYTDRQIAAEEEAKQAALRRYELEENAAYQERVRLDFLEKKNRLMEQRQSR